MPTRPGYIWSGTEWVSIGQEAVVAPVSYQTSAPSTPATGDIWIDSNDDVPGIDTSQFLRWRKTMSGGETSVSGTDDNGLTLQYTANYEQVYLNGVLLVRGQDYTATNGTSITGLTALAANDVVEVFGVVARVVGDVYTQAQTNSLLDAKSNVSTTGMVLLSSNTFTSVSSVSFDNVFTSAYPNYQFLIYATTSANSDIFIRMRSAGSDDTSSNYINQEMGANNTTVSSLRATQSFWYCNQISVATEFAQSWTLYNPNVATPTLAIAQGYIASGTSVYQTTSVNKHNVNTAYSGATFYVSGATMTGTIKVYGYK